jgi:hypothetical protein
MRERSACSVGCDWLAASAHGRYFCRPVGRPDYHLPKVSQPCGICFHLDSYIGSSTS